MRRRADHDAHDSHDARRRGAECHHGEHTDRRDRAKERNPDRAKRPHPRAVMERNTRWTKRSEVTDSRPSATATSPPARPTGSTSQPARSVENNSSSSVCGYARGDGGGARTSTSRSTRCFGPFGFRSSLSGRLRSACRRHRRGRAWPHRNDRYRSVSSTLLRLNMIAVVAAEATPTVTPPMSMSHRGAPAGPTVRPRGKTRWPPYFAAVALETMLAPGRG